MPAVHGVLAPLIKRNNHSSDAFRVTADSEEQRGGTYPCYQATCAGNATCCHYGGADMCCWNGGGGVAGPVSMVCGGVAFGGAPRGLCCPADRPFGCPGFTPGTACCGPEAPICCQHGGCCPLGTACNGVHNGTVRRALMQNIRPSNSAYCGSLRRSPLSVVSTTGALYEAPLYHD